MKTLWLVLVQAAVLGNAATTGAPAQPPGVHDLAAPDETVREHAARKLGGSANRQAVPALANALADASPRVRARAAWALAQLKDKRATPQLVTALNDPDATVRFNAAYALGEIKDPQAGPALIRALRDPSWNVRDQAAWALRELNRPDIAKQTVNLLNEPDADIEHVIWILQHASPETAGKALKTMLKADDTKTRRQALKLLANTGSAKAENAVIEALGDRDPVIRLLALQTLAANPGDRLEKPLERLLETETDEAIRKQAAAMLRNLARAKGLAAHWPFEDTSPTVTTDATGWGSDGNTHKTTSVPGKRGKALYFNGDAYVDLGKPAELNIANREFAITAWIKPEKVSGVVVARGGAWSGYSLFIQEGHPGFGIHRLKDGPTFMAIADKTVSMNTWLYLAGVVREKKIELYVNGKLAATVETPGPIPNNTGQPMCIGFDSGNSAVGIVEHFVGAIDEVKAHSVPLTEAQIHERYHKGQ